MGISYLTETLGFTDDQVQELGLRLKNHDNLDNMAFLLQKQEEAIDALDWADYEDLQLWYHEFTINSIDDLLESQKQLWETIKHYKDLVSLRKITLAISTFLKAPFAKDIEL